MTEGPWELFVRRGGHTAEILGRVRHGHSISHPGTAIVVATIRGVRDEKLSEDQMDDARIILKALEMHDMLAELIEKQADDYPLDGTLGRAAFLLARMAGGEPLLTSTGKPMPGKEA